MYSNFAFLVQRENSLSFPLDCQRVHFLKWKLSVYLFFPVVIAGILNLSDCFTEAKALTAIPNEFEAGLCVHWPKHIWVLHIQ